MRRRSLIQALVAAPAFAAICGCRAQAEASAEFDSSRMKEMLLSFEPLLPHDNWSSYIDQMVTSFQSMKVQDVKDFTFEIVRNGMTTPVRIELRKEDVDVVELRVFTDPSLVTELQAKMATVLH